MHVFTSGSRQDKKESKDPHVYYYTSTAFRPYPTYKVALFPFFSNRRVKSLGIELVHSHGMATMGLAAVQVSRQLKLPSVATFHTMIPEATHYISKRKIIRHLAGKVAWKYLSWYFGFFDVVTCPSIYTQKVLAKHGIKAEVIPNGIDVRRFRPEAPDRQFRRHWGLGGKKVILSTGRLVQEKNLDLLIDSALYVREEMPESVFLIVGKGPAAEYYRNRVKEKGLSSSFIFTGFLPDNQLPLAYNAADIFTFPSFFETQGLVGLEAMACAKPVAAADRSATQDFIVPGKNGNFFKNEPEDCAKQIIKTLEQAEKGKCAKACRETALQYSLPICGQRLLKLYERLI